VAGYTVACGLEQLLLLPRRWVETVAGDGYCRQEMDAGTPIHGVAENLPEELVDWLAMGVWFQYRSCKFLSASL